MFSIYHGPQLLITAKSLEGRKLTGWKSIRQDIIYAGATFVDEKMVEDGNLITRRSPNAAGLYQGQPGKINRLTGNLLPTPIREPGISS